MRRSEENPPKICQIKLRDAWRARAGELCRKLQETVSWRCRIRELVSQSISISTSRASLGFKVIKSPLAQLDGRIAVASNTPRGLTVQLKGIPGTGPLFAAGVRRDH